MLVVAILSTVVVLAFHAFIRTYPTDSKMLGPVLHAAAATARDSGGATLTIGLRAPATVTLTSGVTSGGATITTETLSTVPTVSGVAGTTATFIIDPSGLASLNGLVCGVVSVKIDSQTYSVNCTDWSVSP
ncbi:MAG TPA: hypothetical protein VNF68_05715 [Candidatus Baltobacteraceae bacterium]|nr:hypothetical protein [Candidatus Baltobacteraceae bacterium]